ncbi:MAG: ribose 5-phosphate isomerase B [Eubacteriaceae bacterium]|jgi:ribose 5-phosphate isomerase B|nr:ribose 5-phosphate isomerase B [Eubacteriaceae bacterium]
MKIAIGSDHAAYELKESIKKMLIKEGYDLLDVGTNSSCSVDYPVYGLALAKAVAAGEAKYGIALCGSGIGMSIVANKVHGIRAALACDGNRVALARQHNNANVLVIGARFTEEEAALEMVKVFLQTEFEGQRHEKRVQLITEYEQKSHE